MQNLTPNTETSDLQSVEKLIPIFIIKLDGSHGLFVTARDLYTYLNLPVTESPIWIPHLITEYGLFENYDFVGISRTSLHQDQRIDYYFSVDVAKTFAVSEFKGKDKADGFPLRRYLIDYNRRYHAMISEIQRIVDAIPPENINPLAVEIHDRISYWVDQITGNQPHVYSEDDSMYLISRQIETDPASVFEFINEFNKNPFEGISKDHEDAARQFIRNWRPSRVNKISYLN